MKHALDFFRPNTLNESFDDWFGKFSTPFSEIQKRFTNSPKVNVKETDKAYEIEIANPGFSKEDTEVKVLNNVIYVTMNCETHNEDEGEYHVQQWSKSSYSESWNIPDNVIEDEITAKNVDGVLTITLPKREEKPKSTDEGRTIEIV